MHLRLTSSAALNENVTEEAVFIEARDTFLASLQPRERTSFAKCSSAEQLIKEVQDNRSLSRNPSLLKRSISKMDSLNKALSPYFDAIGMFVQSNPEFTAIAWGAIRLALQVSNHEF